MKKVPESEIKARGACLQEILQQKNIDFALIRQNVDKYYYTGTFQDGILLYPSGGKPVLFVRRTVMRAELESPIEKIIGFKGILDLINTIKDMKLNTSTIGLEMDVIPTIFYRSLCSHFPKAQIVDISYDIRSARSVKSEYEVSILKGGGRKLDNVFQQMMHEIKIGMTEFDVYKKMTALFLDHEASLYVRTRMFNMEVLSCTVLSGKSASNHSAMDSPAGGGDGISLAFPAGAGFKKLCKGEPILIDVAFSYEGYIVDCTRIFSLGKLSPTFMKAHGISGECHSLFYEILTKGASIPEIYQKIFSQVDRCGLADVFMGNAKFIGHGVGLELDEYPILTENFEGTIHDGMVIAFEPKFVFEDGTVGFENTYYIRDGKPESVSNFSESINVL